MATLRPADLAAATAALALNADLRSATSAFLPVLSALWEGAAITGESGHRALLTRSRPDGSAIYGLRSG
jgi:hypothetical protein